MRLISFLNLVEIRTKVASMIPFIFGTLYTVYRFNKFNLNNFILMFLSLLTFDMATTAINNYMDFKRANKTSGYNYENHNAIVKYGLKRSTTKIVISILLFFAVLSGFVLFLNTNIIVLLLGIMSFIVGVLYSYGPIPISRTPFGEIFSGVFMGFIIVSISVYIHLFNDNLVTVVLINGRMNLSVNILEVIYIILVSIPLIVGIANIMLANNICDIEDDIANKRYTLPIYIGRKNALRLYKAMYYIAFISLISTVLLDILPIPFVLTLITFFKVRKNITVFYTSQTKKDTFITSVQNFVLVNVAQIIILGIVEIIKEISK